MVDGWELARWLGTWSVAFGALVLGIRAERRARKYAANWTIHAKHDTGTVINRTGEDASHVSANLFPGGGSFLFERDIVHDGESVSFTIDRPIHQSVDVVQVRWKRPADGNRYLYFDSDADRRKRWSRVVSALGAFRADLAKRKVAGRRDDL
ncbi:hypothetical protein [Cryobacterium luteum]|uniref:Uncharacterized protein n=1 Tax=Cryobacterium luteum TaxID=1424661 RepID=A0A5F0D2D7_9MICO|nr:hypothetical protein [Cryobacterium luteum]TFB88607.1 hypothetical protein E3O10_12575 [Cryobacterium luteum]